MWEVIETNHRKSFWLLVLLFLLFALLGMALGGSLVPEAPWIGIIPVLVLWLGMLGMNLAAGESLLLHSAGARKIAKADAPQLYNVVEEMKIANGLAVMPDLYIIDSRVPNAFAVGLRPERAAVAVTSGLLARLKRDELQGVIAHEVAHIQNRDTQFMTLAGVTLGALIMIADFYLRHVRRTAPRTRNSEGGHAVALLTALALILAVLAPVLARVLYFACSRKREYLADACSARATRYPEGLAHALHKIAGEQNRVDIPVNRTLAPMYIVNPLAAHGGRSSWFSSHPPTKDRINILIGMAGEFSLRAYETMFRHLHSGQGVIGSRSLHEEQAQTPLAVEAEDDESASPQESWRDAKDIIHRVNGFFMLPCLCGARLKLPPEFDDEEVTCPHCGKKHPVDRDFVEAATSFGTVKELLGGQADPA